MTQLSDKTGNGLFKQKNCPYFVKSSSLPARKGYEGLASVVRMRATMLQSQIIPNKKRFMLKSLPMLTKFQDFDILVITMASYPSGKGQVCKTSMHRFNSD